MGLQRVGHDLETKPLQNVLFSVPASATLIESLNTSDLKKLQASLAEI